VSSFPQAPRDAASLGGSLEAYQAGSGLELLNARLSEAPLPGVSAAIREPKCEEESCPANETREQPSRSRVSIHQHQDPTRLD